MLGEGGLTAARAAEIIVTVANGRGRRGSGYLIRDGVLLTAAHVVRSAERISVRFDADLPTERVLDAQVLWCHHGMDFALLGVPGENTDAPVAFGHVGEYDAILKCSTLGFPRFKLRTYHNGANYRDTCHAEGTSPVLSHRREGTLELIVAPPEHDADPEHSPWEGMSGAPVFSNGLLIGIVGRHHRSDGLGRLAVLRIDRWFHQLEPADVGVLQGLLRRPVRASGLPDAIPAGTWGMVRGAYQAQVHDIAPDDLIGREAEVAQLIDFCAGDDQYQWWQAPPWAGKTALAAWFSLHAPVGVVTVPFFVTARLAGQADSDAFTDALIEQLAELVNTPPAMVTNRDSYRRALINQAAQRLNERGERLLIVVDGLDEDEAASPGSNRPSIASLLPPRPPANVRVLVTSRPHPELPSDVAPDHPLRHLQIRQLGISPSAQHTRDGAQHELFRALRSGPVPREILGFVAAARGGLTIHDLEELTGIEPYELKIGLNSSFGRSLSTRARGTDTAERGYLVAHETLRDEAEAAIGSTIEKYRLRLHAWARTYQELQWPAHTPSYLLQAYGRVVQTESAGSRRHVELVVDPNRHRRLRAVTGADAAALRELALARDALRSSDRDEDLWSVCMLAFSETCLVARNAALTADLPALWTALGKVDKGVALARCISDASRRSVALAAVARQVVQRDSDRARRLVDETEVLVDQVDQASTAAKELHSHLAVVYAALGQHSMALTTALFLMDLYDRAQVLLAVLRAVPAGDRKSLSAAAHSLARAQTTAGADTAALFTIAGLALLPTEPARCAALVGKAVEWRGTSDEVAPLAMTALLLAKVDPRYARILARRAALTARRGWRAAEDETAAVQALVRCGEFDEATEIVRCAQPTVLDRVQRALNRELAAHDRTSPWGNAWGPGWVEGLIERGQAQQALMKVWRPSGRSKTATLPADDEYAFLCAVALAQCAPETAESVARDLERASFERADLPQKEYAVAAVAQMLVDGEDDLGGERLARTLPDRDAKVAVLLHLARAYATRNQERAVELADEAHHLLDAMVSRDARGRVDRYAAAYWARSVGVVEVLARAGRSVRARELCDAFADRLSQADALAVLAASLGEGQEAARAEAKEAITALIELLHREEDIDPFHPFRQVDPELFGMVVDEDLLFCYVSEVIANRGVISNVQRDRLATAAQSLGESGLVDAELGAAALVSLRSCPDGTWEGLLAAIKRWEGECAEIVCALAATGDFKEAMRVAGMTLEVPDESAAPQTPSRGDMLEALAMVAELAVGVDVSRSELLGAAPGQVDLPSARRIQACIPRGSGQGVRVPEDRGIGRRIVHHLLTTDKWFLALRPLSVLAPEGVARLRQVALGQADLDGTGDP
ncbi:trypsin-like peptidase domain-containing protein [Streptomyces sp. NPDC051243]|uniref:trypsin-like peptidase domain-containing protein n=1 Tax=Streptomyces sp. NPDC051243 TaxID=3365646 RepID=UPI0037929BA2